MEKLGTQGLGVISVTLLLVACGTTVAPTRPHSPVRMGQAKVNGKPEQVLTNSHGKTLYYFTKDTSGKSHGTLSCGALWSAVVTTSSHAPTVAGLKGKLKIIQGAHGKQPFALHLYR